MFLRVSKVGSFNSFSMAERLLRVVIENVSDSSLLDHFHLMNEFYLPEAPD